MKQLNKTLAAALPAFTGVSRAIGCGAISIADLNEAGTKDTFVTAPGDHARTLVMQSLAANK